MKIEYKVNYQISGEEFRQILLDSTLGERRPISDQTCLNGMIENSNLTITAWHNDKLVGISRSVTDFHYACYLSDLAVHVEFQKSGIGKELIVKTQKQLGPQCNLILIAAPAAKHYYKKIGFTQNHRCWVLPHTGKLSNQ